MITLSAFEAVPLLRAIKLGTENDGSIFIEVPMTQDIMASFAHLSRERTNIILGQLRRRKLISIEKRYITIPDVNKLRDEL